MTFLVCEYRGTWNFFLRDDDARIVAARLGFSSREECLAAIASVKASMGASVVDAAEEHARAGELGPDGPTFTLFGTANHWRYEFCDSAGQMVAGGQSLPHAGGHARCGQPGAGGGGGRGEVCRLQRE